MKERCRICGETVPVGVRLLHLASVHRIDCAIFTVDPVMEESDRAIIDYYEEPVSGEWKTVHSSRPMEEWSIPELLEHALHIVDMLLKCLRDMDAEIHPSTQPMDLLRARARYLADMLKTQ